MAELYTKVFPKEFPYYNSSGQWSVTGTHLQFGHAFLSHSKEPGQTGGTTLSLLPLHHMLQPMESLLTCLDMHWMTLLVCHQIYTGYHLFPLNKFWVRLLYSMKALRARNGPKI